MNASCRIELIQPRASATEELKGTYNTSTTH
jgi:hypothetical protein